VEAVKEVVVSRLKLFNGERYVARGV